MPLSTEDALTLTGTVRAHLRLPLEDGVITEETNADLILYTQAAVEYCEAVTGLDLSDTETWPASVLASVLLVAADLYENREAQSAVELYRNPTVDNLLWTQRVF
jgi:hypothetical protein